MQTSVECEGSLQTYESWEKLKAVTPFCASWQAKWYVWLMSRFARQLWTPTNDEKLEKKKKQHKKMNIRWIILYFKNLFYNK